MASAPRARHAGQPPPRLRRPAGAFAKAGAERGFGALLAALPIDRVEPTPFQRDPSQPHVKRLMNVIETLGRFLDPIIAMRHDGVYWTPNGNHRLQALRKLGGQSIVALLV